MDARTRMHSQKMLASHIQRCKQACYAEPTRRLASNTPTGRKCIQPLRYAFYAIALILAIPHHSLTPHTPLPAQTPSQSPPWPVRELCGAHETLATS